MNAEPLEALFHPFESGRLDMPPDGASVLFINGRSCAALEKFRRYDVAVQQYFRPAAQALQAAGIPVVPEIPGDGSFDLVLVHGSRQHQETMSALAAALRRLKPGGTLVCAAANDAGGKRLERDLATLGIASNAESKFKSRIVVASGPAADHGQLDAAIAAGACQPVMDGRYVSRPGVFCWDRVDAGSALLAEALPELPGRGADFGCGYGFLAEHILRKSAGMATLACIDADARAVECCRLTLEKNGLARAGVECLWADITDAAEDLPAGLDWIVMNPPFHEGHAALPRIGMAFIERAAGRLRPGGVLWMVANTGLPYEKILADNFRQSARLREDKGYKLYRAEK